MHTTYASVDLSALGHNLSKIRAYLPHDCRIMAVVKANAYGHGAIEISRALVLHGVSRLAVASAEEGAALREHGISCEIVVLADLIEEHIPELLAHRLTPVVTNRPTLALLAKTAAERNIILPIHLKVDTGMGRLGFSPIDIGPLFEELCTWKSIHAEGLMTHLADSDGESTLYSEQQLRIFQQVLDHAAGLNIRIPIVHAANSAALVRFPQSHYSMVRPGIMLYGYHTLPPETSCAKLKPVLSLHTTVMHVRTIKTGESVSYNRTFVAKRESRIAVLPIGYADGYSRRLSNNGVALINGRRAPIVGLVCMDMTMIDVTDAGPVKAGNDVTLLGTQGEETIGADHLAEWIGTIPYEVLCGIGPRIPRVYRTV